MPSTCTYHTLRFLTPRRWLCKELVLALTFLLTTAGAQPNKTALLDAVATANTRRAELEQYVKALKAAVRPPDPAYAESQRRYVSAYNLYNGLVTQLAASLGSSRRTTALATTAGLVERETAEFTEYASEILFGKRRSIPGLAHSTTTLIAVVNDQQQAFHINRHTATALLTDLQWQSWTDIR